MKHIKDAKQFLEDGDSAAALGVLDNLLSLAPRNPDALRLKAEILEGWGRFDESIGLLHTMSQQGALDDEALDALNRCATEEKEALVFSELTEEGRVYFAFPRSQIWISLYGFLGCAGFLLMSSSLLVEGQENIPLLATLFVFLVIFPWLGLLISAITGVKKVIVGTMGIKICTRFKENKIGWDGVKLAVIEYDPDINTDYLKVRLYGRAGIPPVAEFDISRRTSVVKARRHFLRNILTYVDVVCYLPRGTSQDSLLPFKTSEIKEELPSPSENTAGNENRVA